MPNENGSLNASREFLFLFGCFENKKTLLMCQVHLLFSLIFIIADKYTGRNTFLMITPYVILPVKNIII